MSTITTFSLLAMVIALASASYPTPAHPPYSQQSSGSYRQQHRGNSVYYPPSPGHTVVDECTCHEKGNYYSPVSSDNCRSFTQRTAYLPAVTQNCPHGLQFDVQKCVCNYAASTRCPAYCPVHTQYQPATTHGTCRAYGSIYAIVPGTQCSQFTQATATLSPQRHYCSPGLKFDLTTCVCNYAKKVNFLKMTSSAVYISRYSLASVTRLKPSSRHLSSSTEDRMKFLLAIAVSLAFAAASPDSIVINSCTCFEKGNFYSPNSANNCGSFFQRTAFLQAVEQNCPDGLQFDIQECVCNWPSAMTCPSQCPGSPPNPGPVHTCTENGNIYSPVAGTNCAQFTQATDILPPQTHNCPAGLMFNLDVCVCDWPWRTNCPKNCTEAMVEANTDFPFSFACGIIEELQHQFQERFADLHAKADELRLFQNPFEVDAAAYPDSLQLERSVRALFTEVCNSAIHRGQKERYSQRSVTAQFTEISNSAIHRVAKTKDKMKILIAAACLAFAAASPDSIVINSCTCFEKGNFYSPNSANNCGSFFQRTAFLQAVEQNCPDGLQFDIQECVCNWPSAMTCPSYCPGSPPNPGPVHTCSENGNIYSPVAGTNCAQFTQSTAILPPQTHNCPAGLMFNLDVCVCDWPWRTNCPNRLSPIRARLALCPGNEQKLVTRSVSLNNKASSASISSAFCFFFQIRCKRSPEVTVSINGNFLANVLAGLRMSHYFETHRVMGLVMLLLVVQLAAGRDRQPTLTNDDDLSAEDRLKHCTPWGKVNIAIRNFDGSFSAIDRVPWDLLCAVSSMECTWSPDGQLIPPSAQRNLLLGDVGLYGLNSLTTGEFSKLLMFETKNNHSNDAEPYVKHGCHGTIHPDKIPTAVTKSSAVIGEPWIALIQRGECYFSQKLENAIDTHGAKGFVIYNNDDVGNQEVIMNLTRTDLTTIMIDHSIGKNIDYLNLLLDYLPKTNPNHSLPYTNDIFVNITFDHCAKPAKVTKTPLPVTIVTITFVVVMIMALAWLVFFFFQKHRNSNRAMMAQLKKQKAAKKALKRIGERVIREVDEEVQEDCTYCLEPLAVGETIRDLPCRHKFHKDCVEDWLIQNRTCPNCQGDILVATGLYTRGGKPLDEAEGTEMTEVNLDRSQLLSSSQAIAGHEEENGQAFGSQVIPGSQLLTDGKYMFLYVPSDVEVPPDSTIQIDNPPLQLCRSQQQLMAEQQELLKSSQDLPDS
ncbi:uncharacterized protein [Watersipora subatra]|uniref:uncharacterized protein n=1 Tax=Watersipora subatra TaxID=2589382 RepID=UPI00355BFDF9